MSLKTSSNGKVLYIYNAGNTIDLYDAGDLSSIMRTITLDGDMTTELFVVPVPAASTPRSTQPRAIDVHPIESAPAPGARVRASRTGGAWRWCWR